MAAAVSRLNELEMSQPDGKFPSPVLNPHLTYPFIAELCVKNSLLEVVSSIIGPNIVLLSSTLFIKYPSDSVGPKYVGAHQDLKYWGLQGSPDSEVTAWLALDSAGSHNGSLCFLPGSHKRGLLDHGRGDRKQNMLQENQNISLTKEEEDQLVQSELDSGQASLHHGLMVHLSPPNMSKERRAGLQIIFTIPEMKLVEQTYTNKYDKEWRLPVLVKGEDKSGQMKYVTDIKQILDQDF